MSWMKNSKWLRQVSRGHLWHRYSVAVNQVMVVIVKLSSDDFNLTNRNPWFRNFLILVSTNPLSKKYRYEPLSLEYRINWEIYTPYAGAAGILLHINGKFTMRKLKSSLLSSNFVLNRPSLSISRCRSRYETDLSVTVVFFISSSMG